MTYELLHGYPNVRGLPWTFMTLFLLSVVKPSSVNSLSLDLSIYAFPPALFVNQEGFIECHRVPSLWVRLRGHTCYLLITQRAWEIALMLWTHFCRVYVVLFPLQACERL